MTDAAIAALHAALAEVYSGPDLDDALALADQLEDLGFTVTASTDAE